MRSLPIGLKILVTPLHLFNEVEVMLQRSTAAVKRSLTETECYKV
jgi:hypothetical protein